MRAYDQRFDDRPLRVVEIEQVRRGAHFGP
jgi:hypothetical protein